MKYQALLVPVLLSLLLSIPSVAQALNVGLSFTGTSFCFQGPPGTPTLCALPPDTMGAVGPDSFVELNNERYGVNRKSDGVTVQSNTLNDFWRNAGVTPSANLPFDPRVLYDPSSQRWFASSADNPGGPNNFLVAVSNSSDPTQGWKGFAIPSDSTNFRFADFPTLGVNRDGVYVSAHLVPIGGGTLGVGVLVLPKADLIAGTVANRTLFQSISGDPGFPGLNLQPAVDPKGQLPEILLSGPNPFLPDSFTRRDIVGSITSPMLAPANTLISVPRFDPAPDAPQPGPKLPIETGNFLDRLTSSVVLRNGELWGVESVNKDGRAALRWFDINVATDKLRQSGLIASPVLSFYYGSLAVNDFGDVVIGFNGSGPTQFVSAYAVQGRTIGGVTTFGDPVLLQSGVSGYEQNFSIPPRNRWGDYSATTLDPNDPNVFWTIQEWVSGTDIWSTQIIELDVVPEPTTLILFGTTIAGLGLARWRQRSHRRQCSQK